MFQAAWRPSETGQFKVEKLGRNDTNGRQDRRDCHVVNQPHMMTIVILELLTNDSINGTIINS